MLPPCDDALSVSGHPEAPHRARLAAVASTNPFLFLRWMCGAVGTYE